MIDWSAWISAGSAVVSAIMAGITVWWPWHNRPQADWTLLKYSTHPDTPLSATVPGLNGAAKGSLTSSAGYTIPETEPHTTWRSKAAAVRRISCR